MRPAVLHITPALSRGGAGRATTFLAAALGRRLGRSQTIVSLRPASPDAVGAAERAGVTVVQRPPADLLDEAIGRADLVHLHFWNSPPLYELLERPLPPARLLVWSLVSGQRAPQVLLADVCRRAHTLVATSVVTAELPVVREHAPATRVLAVCGGELGRPPKRDATAEPFTVGYVGTVGWAKLHPEFVAMSASAALPNARFVVCGGGDAVRAVRAAARRHGQEARFDVRGPVADVAGALAAMDVFGYPLCRDSYATVDLALQEAMASGLPPVVLAHDANAREVEHGRTGFVAQDDGEYPLLLERLHDDPEARRRLGDAAAAHAHATWSPERHLAAWKAIYDELLQAPKRPVDPLPAPAGDRHPGAGRLVRSLGAHGDPFRRSLEGDADADHVVARCSPTLATADGGLLDYRRSYPEDGMLALWTGLHFAAQGRPALAAGQLADARRLGVRRAMAGSA